MIGPSTAISARPHKITLQNPGGPAVSDGDGGSTQGWIDLDPPSLFVEIKPATAKDLERVAASTVLSMNTYIVKGPYHAQVTTQTRIIFGTRIFNVTGPSNPEERSIEMILTAVEVVP